MQLIVLGRSGEISLLSIAPDSPIAAPELGTAAHRTAGVPRASAPVLSVLTALSFSHLLNDAMQSLIPAIYPILKSALHLDFVHIGLIRPDQSVDGFGPPAFCRLLHGPAAAAFLARRRNEFHARRPGPALVCRHLDVGSYRCGAGRRRFVGLPSGSFSHRAHRLGRTVRLRPIVLSSRRQRRRRAGPSSGRRHRRRPRTISGLVVLAAGLARNCCPDWNRALVSREPCCSPNGESRGRPSARHAATDAWPRDVFPRRSGRTDFFEIFLPRKHVELLHVFPDRKVRALGQERATSSLRFSFRRRGRHLARRAQSAIASAARA